MPAIPADQIVSVVPNVIGAGGAALDLIGLILTQSVRPPIGTVPSFPDLLSVEDYFGVNSPEAGLAQIYFLGFDGSTVKPGKLLFSQYPAGSVGAWLLGSDISGMTLATLQALSGSLNVTVDGVVKTGASINLAGATSFSSAATIIGTGLGLTPLTGATVTGSIAATTLTVTAVTSGTLAIGDVLSGGTITAGTAITGFLTGTGGTGTYSVTPSQTAASTTITAVIPPVTYDSQAGAFRLASSTAGASSTIGFASGTLAAPLLLTQATGAVTSQGAVAATPAAAMAAIISVTQDWASFMTAFEPSTNDKVAFAQWTNGTGNKYAYAMWTTNAAATIVPDTTTAGALIQAANYSGTELIYETDARGDKAAFFLGYGASLDTAATEGRATAMFRSQSGLAADVVNGTIAQNLKANGYSFYGDYSTRNDDFLFYSGGSITGPFKWADSYINQIWMNSAFQLALIEFMVAMKSIPYAAPGYAGIEAALLDPITAAVNFGAIRAGVSLSNAEIVEVNTAAGVKIDTILSTRGWYLQVKDPTAQVRQARGTPVCNFWYMDGQSVQFISLSSVEVL